MTLHWLSSRHTLSEKELGLTWLIRLRWLALAFQLAVALFADRQLGYRLPWPLFTTCFALLAATNLPFHLAWETLRQRPVAACGVLIFLDIALLTLMLYASGGAHNPFTGIYVLQVALAASLLPSPLALGSLLASAAGFFYLFSSPHTLLSESGNTCCSSMDAHLKGMLISMLLSGLGVLYFIRRLQHEVRRQRRILEETHTTHHLDQRHRDVAALAAGVAHELATPLSTIAITAADLRRLPNDTQDLSVFRQDADLIRREVDRCQDIIARLSRESQSLDSPDPETPFPLDDLALQLQPFLPESMKARFRLTLEQSGLAARVPAGRFLQALAVLLKNAIEASPPESQPHLRVQRAEPDLLLIEVQDTGPGVDETTLKRLGEPFFTRKASTGGLGLGLFLARSFALSVGGKLEFHSQPGHGTTARLFIPLHPQP